MVHYIHILLNIIALKNVGLPNSYILLFIISIKKMQERLCKVITIILASIKIITNKNKIYNIKLTKSFKKINYWLTIKNKFDIINMVKYMNEYIILIVILSFLLLIYTIYIY